MQKDFWPETRKIITDAINAVKKKSLAIDAEDKDFFETHKRMCEVLHNLLGALHQVDNFCTYKQS